MLPYLNSMQVSSLAPNASSMAGRPTALMVPQASAVGRQNQGQTLIPSAFPQGRLLALKL